MERTGVFFKQSRSWLLGWLLLLVAFPVWSNDTGQLLEEANRLLLERKDQEALSLYEQVIKQDPKQFDALCHASLLHAQVGSRVFDETTRTVHYRAAEIYAGKALALKPESAEANFAMATAYNHLCQVVSIRQKMVLLRDMKLYLDTALAKDSCHAGTWHLLGRWHFRAANYSLPELLVTNVVMRGFAKEASNDKAVEAMVRAISLAPQNIRYYYDLARIHHLNRNQDASVVLLNEALKLDLVTDEELEINRKCKALLREMKLPTI